MGATGWSLRSITINFPAGFEVFPLGKNVALPDRDTIMASSGWGVMGPVTSQTVTRSLSIDGFGAVWGLGWNSSAHRNRVGNMETLLFVNGVQIQDTRMDGIVESIRWRRTLVLRLFSVID